MTIFDYNGIWQQATSKTKSWKLSKLQFGTIF